MQQSELPYFHTQADDTILLAIVGKDPFPQDPKAIPFCKSDWDSQLRRTCSGRHVLCSLGVDIEDARRCYEVPDELFKALRNAGIVFLNASYQYLGCSITRQKHLGWLEQAHEVNLPFLTKAKTVILCGEAKRIRWLPGMKQMGIAVVHPDERCRISRCERVRAGWAKYWSPMAISRRFQIPLPANRPIPPRSDGPWAVTSQAGLRSSIFDGMHKRAK